MKQRRNIKKDNFRQKEGIKRKLAKEKKKKEIQRTKTEKKGREIGKDELRREKYIQVKK